MSKYDKETKFYWLQLKEDFFEDDAIEWLEEQKPNGRDYAYFYLKLCLKALKSNGILIRKVGNILIPYDNNKLAELTKMDFDTVTVAMELLKQIGLVQILDNGEIYITQLEDLIGSISKGAFRKQQQLERRKEKENMLGWTEGGKVSTKDKDKDKDINIYIHQNQNDFESEFDELWKKYPNKQGRKDALRHYISARKKNVSFEKIDKGIDGYVEYVKRNSIAKQFIMHGSTWFCGEHWEDDYKNDLEVDPYAGYIRLDQHE